MGRLIAYLDSIKARDPAPRSRLEILTYPGVWALGYHRIAHRLFKARLFFLARAGSRVGANAVVTRDVVEGAVMVGIPARATMVEGGQKPVEFLAYGTPCRDMFDPATQK
eukprot:gene27817-30848_t